MSEQRFGDFVVHYNALPTLALGEAIAREYGIERAKRRMLINVVVRRYTDDGTGNSVAAHVSGEAVNLTGRKAAITFRTIAGEDVGTIGVFDIAGPDTVTIALSIRPEGEERSFALRFSQNIAGE